MRNMIHVKIQENWDYCSYFVMTWQNPVTLRRETAEMRNKSCDAWSKKLASQAREMLEVTFRLPGDKIKFVRI